MLIAKGFREDAIKALINTWLKDPAFYCAHCDKRYVYEDFLIEPCCENPLINNNIEITKLFLRELREVKETRKNDFASNDDKTSRWALSMPTRLYSFLDQAFRRLYKQRLITKEYGIAWFAKKFPQFVVAKTI